MDPRNLLNLIGSVEAPGGYYTAYGGSQFPQGMTVGETIEWARRHGRKTGSSAVGRYQFLAPTLEGLVKNTGIGRDVEFSPGLQDYLGGKLLEQRGYTDWRAGKLPTDRFARNLSQEWAALPRGPDNLSYYHGDKMGNKAQLGWDKMIGALGGAPQQLPQPEPPQPPQQQTAQAGQSPMNPFMPQGYGNPFDPNQDPQKPSLLQALAGNPMLQMGLGILSAGGGSAIQNIARGMSQGLNSAMMAQEAQAKLDMVMMQQKYELQDREEKQRLAMESRVTAEQIKDPVMRALFIRNPQAYATIAAEQGVRNADMQAATMMGGYGGYAGAPGAVPGAGPMGYPPMPGAETMPLPSAAPMPGTAPMPGPVAGPPPGALPGMPGSGSPPMPGVEVPLDPNDPMRGGAPMPPPGLVGAPQGVPQPLPVPEAPPAPQGATTPAAGPPVNPVAQDMLQRAELANQVYLRTGAPSAREEAQDLRKQAMVLQGQDQARMRDNELQLQRELAKEEATVKAERRKALSEANPLAAQSLEVRDQVNLEIDRLLAHPGIRAGTGLSAMVPAIPGTAKYDFMQKSKKVKSQAFRVGFEALKGAGPISEFEGKSAAESLANMEEAQTYDQYVQEVETFRRIVNGIADRRAKAAGYEPEPWVNPEKKSSSGDEPLTPAELEEYNRLKSQLGL